MANEDGTFLYIGTYPSEAAARVDHELVKSLHEMGFVGTYDSAVITKDPSGTVHLDKDEMATRHGGWGGAAAGALVGILFPPSVIGAALIGGAIGGVTGHLWRGLSRADVRELGELIDVGQAALLVLGTSRLEEALAKVELKAEKHLARQLDVEAKDIDEAVREAAGEIA